jgi:hypothetical protein
MVPCCSILQYVLACVPLSRRQCLGDWLASWHEQRGAAGATSLRVVGGCSPAGMSSESSKPWIVPAREKGCERLRQEMFVVHGTYRGAARCTARTCTARKGMCQRFADQRSTVRVDMSAPTAAGLIDPAGVPQHDLRR